MICRRSFNSAPRRSSPRFPLSNAKRNHDQKETRIEFNAGLSLLISREGQYLRLPVHILDIILERWADFGFFIQVYSMVPAKQIQLSPPVDCGLRLAHGGPQPGRMTVMSRS